MRSEAGYTLLELIVALAVISLITVPMAMSLEFGVAAWRSLHNDISELERDVLVRQRVQYWIENAYRSDSTRQESEIQYPLVGEGQAISFIAPLNPDPRFDSFYRVRLEMEGTHLIMRILPDHASYNIDAAYEQTSLLSGVDFVEFKYLEPDIDAWTGSWAGGKLPSAIRMRLSFTDKNRSWPDLIVSPRREQWAHCIFDKVSGNCIPRYGGSG